MNVTVRTQTYTASTRTPARSKIPHRSRLLRWTTAASTARATHRSSRRHSSLPALATGRRWSTSRTKHTRACSSWACTNSSSIETSLWRFSFLIQICKWRFKSEKTIRRCSWEQECRRSLGKRSFFNQSSWLDSSPTLFWSKKTSTHCAATAPHLITCVTPQPPTRSTRSYSPTPNHGSKARVRHQGISGKKPKLRRN